MNTFRFSCGVNHRGFYEGKSRKITPSFLSCAREGFLGEKIKEYFLGNIKKIPKFVV
jgi:hypothetical protein